MNSPVAKKFSRAGVVALFLSVLAAARADDAAPSVADGQSPVFVGAEVASGLPMGNVVVFGADNKSGQPVLVIYGDGRIVTSGATNPDEGARRLLVSLKTVMRSAYHDLKRMDEALAVLDRTDAPNTERARASAVVKEIRAAWAKKFSTPPVGPQPEDAPADPIKP